MSDKICPMCCGTGTIAVRFGERLLELRTKRNMTQEGLARQVGVSRPQIANIESGRSDPTPHFLVMISRLFSVSTDELLGVSAHDGERQEGDV